MQLDDYLTLNNISVKRFAEDLDIPLSTMKSYFNRTSEPTATNANKIVQETFGAVKLEDLTIEKDQ